MKQEDLKLFIEKFIHGTNTEEEHQQFINWLKIASIEDAVSALDEYLARVDDNASPATECDTGLVAQIEAALDRDESSKEVRFTNNKPWWDSLSGIAAAAALIIFLSGVAIYLGLRRDDNHAVASLSAPQAKSEITPGENKAILTLADGSTIILNDAGVGQVAEQGGSQISKLADGQIVYNSSNGRSAVVVFNSLTTPRGGQFKLTLPDGSKVWLNAASSIKYPSAFSGSERNVEITGEAYFEIEHNAMKPFKVSVNGMEVDVLGTHFNINAYRDDGTVKTTLLEGSVSLKHGRETAVLTPGQQARVDGDKKIAILNNVNVDQIVAWKNGYFSFDRADLQTVMQQLARWYDVEISYESEIPERQFGGKIDRNSNISDVLKILEESKVHFRIDGKKIIVSP